MDYPNLAVKAIFLVMLMLPALRHILTALSCWLALLFCYLLLPMMSQTVRPAEVRYELFRDCRSPSLRARSLLDAAHPAAEWQKAQPVVFCSDWQGKNPDEQRETAVRVLWSSQTLVFEI